MSLWTELLIILVLILANGFFAGSEIAILTARRNRLAQQAKDGSRAAGAALDLARHPDSFLPTVQVGITLVGTLASVFGGARIVNRLRGALGGVPIEPVAEYAAPIAMLIVVVGIAFVSLVLGELVPKRLALNNAEGLARFTARPMQLLATVARPAVWVMGGATRAMMWLLRSQSQPQGAVSVEDIEHLILTGRREGVIDLAEQRMAQRALRLGDRMVRDIMRPRTEIQALEIHTPFERAIAAIAMSGYSRLPVYERDLDHIVGFVYTKDLLVQQQLRRDAQLRESYRPALFVPEYIRISQLLEQFRERRMQMAIVVDEFGGTRGLVTLEDVVEEIVGEIHDEHRADTEQALVRRDERSWLADGGLSMHDLLEGIHRPELHPAVPRDFSTVGGLVQFVLGHIPVIGERAHWNGLDFEVVDMDGRRVDRVMVWTTPTGVA